VNGDVPSRLSGILKVALALGASAPVGAHHSAALFYDQEGGRITLRGTVTEFRFTNPHAIVELNVTADNDERQRWVAETAAPSALRRRGWSQESLAISETVTLEGIRARDGSLLMRITRVTRADGSEVGVPRNADE
jgi:hypothetical protein